MPRLRGIDHVALEVSSIDEALSFLEQVFGPLELRGRSQRMAFIAMGDQFARSPDAASRPTPTATSASWSTRPRRR